MTDTTTPRTEDWLDRLYADEDEECEPEKPPADPAPAAGGGRLPDWRKPPQPLPPPEPPEDDEAEEEEGSGAGDHDAPAADPAPAAAPPPPPAAPAPTDAPAGGWWQVTPSYYPTIPTPTVPAQAERIALSPKTRSALYNASAAGAGWLLGLEPLIARGIASCGAATSIGGALVLGGGIALVFAHFWDRRTRHWWIGLAWAARIPLASAITALALYAPASQL